MRVQCRISLRPDIRIYKHPVPSSASAASNTPGALQRPTRHACKPGCNCAGPLAGELPIDLCAAPYKAGSVRSGQD